MAEKMSLEVYLRFFLSREQDVLTFNIIRQKGLTAAVSKLDVIDPSCSTQQDNISSSGIISVEDIIAVLNELKWQECCVTSLQTFNYCERNLSALKSFDSESTMKLRKIKSESHSHRRKIDGTTS